MRGTHSFLINEESVEFSVLPENHYNPPVLEIRQGFQSLQLQMTNEQLAELEYAVKTHLNGIRYPETPDQQALLHDECRAAIEEEIA